MRYYLMMFFLTTSLLMTDCFAADEYSKMIIVSAEAAMTPDDVSDVSLQYSKQNDIMVLKVHFSDKGRSKFEKLFKGNKGRKLALIDGESVIMKPVYLQIETISDQLDIFIANEAAALKLLKGTCWLHSVQAPKNYCCNGTT